MCIRDRVTTVYMSDGEYLLGDFLFLHERFNFFSDRKGGCTLNARIPIRMISTSSEIA